MVNVINSWAKGIILAIIIATVIEIILPEGNNKKYIKTIVGVYIMFVMIYPLMQKNKINIKSIIQDTSTKMEQYKTEDLKLETNQFIEETYRNKIKEDMKVKIKNKGYKINYINLNIETKNEELYGKVNNINIQLSKTNDKDKQENIKENTIQKIENVEINISNKLIVNEESKCEEISLDEIKELKEYLSKEYGTAKEKIYINE